MNIASVSLEDLAGLIAVALRGEVRSDETNFYFKAPATQHIELSYSLTHLQAVLDSLKNTMHQNELSLYNDNSFEIPAREESAFPYRRIIDDAIRVEDKENLLNYEISAASDVYLAWLIIAAPNAKGLRDIGLAVFTSSPRLERFRQCNALEPVNVFDLIRACSPRLVTIKITSPNKHPIKRYQTATYSFLFHLAYNFDVAYIPHRFFEELSRRGRIIRMRRSATEDLDPPRRTYNEDLIHHYILAISTDSPAVQFLSHYHILEHFFESIFNDDLIDQIKTKMTQPSFSYKRKKRYRGAHLDNQKKHPN